MRLVSDVAERRYAPGERQPRHEHADASLTLLLAGSLEETVGRRRETACALGVVLKPAGVAHEDRFGDAGGRTLQVRLAGDALPPHAAWRWSHAGRPAAALLALLRLRRLGAATPERAEACVAESLAALGEAPAASGDAPRWLSRVKEAVDDAEPGLRVAHLARASGVHPVYLARQFRRWYGETVSGALRRRRLCRAASLAGRRVALTRAAHETGYADLAHLCREFRAGTGLTAGDFRRLVAEEPARVADR